MPHFDLRYDANPLADLGPTMGPPKPFCISLSQVYHSLMLDCMNMEQIPDLEFRQNIMIDLCTAINFSVNYDHNGQATVIPYMPMIEHMKGKGLNNLYSHYSLLCENVYDCLMYFYKDINYVEASLLKISYPNCLFLLEDVKPIYL